MSDSGDTRVEKIAESAWLKIIGRAGLALFVPGILWACATLTSVDRRLAKVETQLQVSPAAYTRDEAVEFAKAIGARFDGMGARFDGDERWIASNAHRLDTLEDARRRALK